jgi:hypothetical protein
MHLESVAMSVACLHRQRDTQRHDIISKKETTSLVEGLSVARVTLDAPNSRTRSRSERLIAPESSKRQAARGSDGSALCRADLTSPRYDATTSLVSWDLAVFGAGSVVAHALSSAVMMKAQRDVLRMRIAPQFSGRALPCDARRERIMKWSARGVAALPNDGPLQLFVRRLR